MKKFTFALMTSLMSMLVALPVGYYIGFAAGAEFEGVMIMRAYAKVTRADDKESVNRLTDTMVDAVILRGAQVRSSLLGPPLSVIYPLDDGFLRDAYKTLIDYNANNPHPLNCDFVASEQSGLTQQMLDNCKKSLADRQTFILGLSS